MKMTALQATSMAVMVVAAVLSCSGVVAPAEGRALLGIGELIDHLKPDCHPPPSDAVPGPYSEPSPEDATPPSPAPAVYEPSPDQYYQPPPYSASPSPVDASPTSPASYQTPPPPQEATDPLMAELLPKDFLHSSFSSST